MTLSVLPVSPAEHTLLHHLYPLYLHDLSEFGAGYSLDAEGLWQPDYLPYWLAGKEGCHPMLFRLDGRPVGFVMVGQAPFPFMTPGRDDRFPGTWELSQLPSNQGAIAFWRRVLGEYMDGAFEDATLDGDPAQVFDSRKRKWVDP